jgi:hypothetical protein
VIENETDVVLFKVCVCDDCEMFDLKLDGKQIIITFF